MPPESALRHAYAPAELDDLRQKLIVAGAATRDPAEARCGSLTVGGACHAILKRQWLPNARVGRNVGYIPPKRCYRRSLKGHRCEIAERNDGVANTSLADRGDTREPCVARVSPSIGRRVTSGFAQTRQPFDNVPLLDGAMAERQSAWRVRQVVRAQRIDADIQPLRALGEASMSTGAFAKAVTCSPALEGIGSSHRLKSFRKQASNACRRAA